LWALTLGKARDKWNISFEANHRSYLRNTNKEELSPEAIKRDLLVLLNDPRAGLVGNIEPPQTVDRSRHFCRKRGRGYHGRRSEPVAD